ncbi:hypothetical protein DUI70_6960 [Streptomyces albus]|nr:hypothetical protein DUI70_6960 [Streptomyces albus]
MTGRRPRPGSQELMRTTSAHLEAGTAEGGGGDANAQD